MENYKLILIYHSISGWPSERAHAHRSWP